MAKFVKLTTAPNRRNIWLNVDHIISMERVGASPATSLSNAMPEHTQLTMCDDQPGEYRRAVLDTPEEIAAMAEGRDIDPFSDPFAHSPGTFDIAGAPND